MWIVFWVLFVDCELFLWPPGLFWSEGMGKDHQSCAHKWQEKLKEKCMN
jgi:hypothetical protein